MRTRSSFLSAALAVVLCAAPAAHAYEQQLTAVQAPEREGFALELAPTPLASAAELKARVQLREGQARIEVAFKNLKPAVLFGGDVTSYVMWAVTHDGKAENLGELWVRDEKDGARFATGLKDFALLVTAETHYLVEKPSEMVVFYSLKPKSKQVKSRAFRYSAFAPAPAHQLRDVSNYSYTGATPLDLLQAEKALELAKRMGAEQHAADAVRQAGVTLAQAKSLSQGSGSSKLVVDYARRSVALASEAMRMTEKINDEQRRADEAARRLAEKQALEARASDAEAARAAAELEKADLAAQIAASRETLEALTRERSDLEATMAALRRESEAAQQASQEERARLETQLGDLAGERLRLVAEVDRVRDERQGLASQLAQLEEQTAALETRRAALESSNARLEELAGRLREEKQMLESRLEGALNSVASTRSTARGLVVSLPDILFDVDKATLKPEASLALAKLSGILALMHELNLRIEGHTDSTGTADHNQRLSENRARSVADFLRQQGVAPERLASAGYGWNRPIADNDSREGRAKNRRVEIVLAEGEVPAAAPAASSASPASR